MTNRLFAGDRFSFRGIKAILDKEVSDDCYEWKKGVLHCGRYVWEWIDKHFMEL